MDLRRTVFDELARFDPDLDLQKRCVHTWTTTEENPNQFRCATCGAMGDGAALPWAGDGKNDERYGTIEAMAALVDRLVPVLRQRGVALIDYSLHDTGRRIGHHRYFSATVTLSMEGCRSEFYSGGQFPVDCGFGYTVRTRHEGLSPHQTFNLQECFALAIAKATHAALKEAHHA